MTQGTHKLGLALTMEEQEWGSSPSPSQKIVFAVGTLPTELKGVSYRKGLSMLVPWLMPT